MTTNNCAWVFSNADRKCSNLALPAVLDNFFPFALHITWAAERNLNFRPRRYFKSALDFTYQFFLGTFCREFAFKALYHLPSKFLAIFFQFRNFASFQIFIFSIIFLNDQFQNFYSVIKLVFDQPDIIFPVEVFLSIFRILKPDFSSSFNWSKKDKWKLSLLKNPFSQILSKTFILQFWLKVYLREHFFPSLLPVQVSRKPPCRRPIVGLSLFQFVWYHQLGCYILNLCNYKGLQGDLKLFFGRFVPCWRTVSKCRCCQKNLFVFLGILSASWVSWYSLVWIRCWNNCRTNHTNWEPL